MAETGMNRAAVIMALNGAGNLAGVDLSNLDLSNLDLSTANLAGANLSRCKLVGVNWGPLVKQNHIHGDERIGRLRGVKLDGADLSDAKFNGLKADKLRDVLKLAGASMAEAKFTDPQAEIDAANAKIKADLASGRIAGDSGKFAARAIGRAM
jgi:uncharacterized protein YjbI with pentapeptide repeats